MYDYQRVTGLYWRWVDWETGIAIAWLELERERNAQEIGSRDVGYDGLKRSKIKASTRFNGAPRIKNLIHRRLIFSRQ